MKAIILSAGQGRRLMPLTESMPKCCLQLHGKTMLEWQIDALAANGFNEVVVVTGFGHHVVKAVIEDAAINTPAGHRRPELRTVYNPFYALSDNLGTCWVARAEMNQPFVLINGDTLFEPSVMRSLLTGSKAFPITLATDRKAGYDDDDMKIVAEGDQLRQVGKKLPLATVNGESIGMMMFSQQGADAFVGRVEQLMGGSDGLARWYLSAIDELAGAGQVGVHSIHGHSWCEVDDLDDLEHAAAEIKSWEERLRGHDSDALQTPSAALSEQSGY